MSRTIIAAVVQMCSRQDPEDNLERASALVRRAHEQGAQLVVLPENFPYIGNLSKKLKMAAPLDTNLEGSVLQRMATLARELQLHLLLGGIPIGSKDPGHFYNTAVLLDPRGEIQASYRKIHLFDINIPGGAVFTESSYVAPGEEVVTTRLLETCLGFSICYDLRFPELYRELSQLGAELIAVPAAFTLHTGKDHWSPLLRARAIENQCFVLAAAQHGHHTDSRTSYGKACIVDPWGVVLARCPDRDSVAVAPLDLDHLEQIRRELPSLRHRRLAD